MRVAGGAGDRAPVRGKRAPVPLPAGVSLRGLGGYFSPEDLINSFFAFPFLLIFG